MQASPGEYLGNRLAIDPELARSFPPAQTLTMTRQSHSSIKIHSVHPPPSIRSILTKAIDGPILVRRRNRTNRPLHWGIIATPFSREIQAVTVAVATEASLRFVITELLCPAGRTSPDGKFSAKDRWADPVRIRVQDRYRESINQIHSTWVVLQASSTGGFRVQFRFGRSFYVVRQI